MIHQKQRNYDKDILEILTQNESITGFNHLKRLGKFHPNMLKNHLTKLENEGRIDIDRTKREHAYYSGFPHIEKEYSKITQFLKQINRSLKNPELTKDESLHLHSNYLKQAFHLLFIYQISSFYPLHKNFTLKRKLTIKKIQKKLLEEIQNKLTEYPERQKALTITLIEYVDAPEVISLKTFREYAKEIKHQEKKIKLRRVKS